jgi:hypothetical protein
VCAVADANQIELRVQGRWTPAHTFPRDFGYISAVSCTSSQFCLVTSVADSVAVWDGARWSLHRFPQQQQLRAASCAAAAECLIGGSTVLGARTQLLPIIRQLDGVWRAPTRLRHGGHQVSSLSCPTPTFCALAQDAIPGQ